ncbi:MAG TPA: hypothetical protein VFQ61_05720, partial [Polyangiaceae bacterium]|nr:hypothetical protein [Polyangiaceae bacterium]
MRKPPSPRIKLLAAAVLGLFATIALVVGVVVQFVLPRYARSLVISEARERGIELTPGDISLGMGWVQVSDATFKLVGVRGVTGQAGIVDVELAGRTPKKFTTNRVKLAVTAEPEVLRHELEGWIKRYQKKFEEPLFVKPLDLEYRRSPGESAEIRANGVEIASSNERLSVRVPHLAWSHFSPFPAALDSHGSQLRIRLALANSSLESPLVNLDLDAADVRLTLAEIRVEQLARWLGLKLDFPGVSVAGNVQFPRPKDLFAFLHTAGSLQSTLKGYVPPHPVELDGFVFGDTTQISTQFALEPENARATLDNFQIVAGRFKLTGKGDVVWEVDHARMRLALAGELPCASLAGAVAESRLGQALGHLTGKAARQVLGGVVGVRVAVDADSREPNQPKVVRRIVAGCGLRALTLKELMALGELLPEALDPRVAQDFQKLLEKPLPIIPGLTPGALDPRKPTTLSLPG